MSLEQDVPVPRHLAIIPDGTRRWASEHGAELESSYRRALRRLTNVIHHAYERGVAAISVYLLSRDNMQRPRDQLRPVYAAERDFLRAAFDEIADPYDVRVTIAGELALLPGDFREAAFALKQATREKTQRRLYLCIAYDPADEIAHALANYWPVGTFDELVSKLWVSEPVDAVIRTGHAQRLSKCLPLQSAYAELFFFPLLFNDFTPAHVDEVLDGYARANRRFGS